MHLNVPLTPARPERAAWRRLLRKSFNPRARSREYPGFVSAARKIPCRPLRWRSQHHQTRRPSQRNGYIAAQYLQLVQMIEDGDVDVVLSEDLGRIHRSPRHQLAFLEDCVDAGVRVICLADQLDTGEDGWENNAVIAGIKHGFAVPDTRRRVNRTATHGFYSGGMVLKYKFGYRRLTKLEADSGKFGPVGLRLVRDDACTPIITAMCEAVLRGVAYDVIAEHLNDDGVAPGPYAAGRWTGAIVRASLLDPILKGVRRFRVFRSRQIRKTGKYIVARNDQPAEQKFYPELAHLTEQEFDELQRVMSERAAKWVGLSGPSNPGSGRPRTQSPRPGQAGSLRRVLGVDVPDREIPSLCERDHGATAMLESSPDLDRVAQ